MSIQLLWLPNTGLIYDVYALLCSYTYRSTNHLARFHYMIAILKQNLFEVGNDGTAVRIFHRIWYLVYGPDFKASLGLIRVVMTRK